MLYSTDSINSELDLLMTAYRQPHRHYHTLKHIDNMFQDLFTICEGQITVVQYYAVWYHDAVYYVGSETNEIDSATLFARKSQLNEEQSERVKQIILSTAYHHIDQNIDYECQCILDADLARMGRSWDIYNNNSKLLRLESQTTNYKSYLLGRVKWLKAMLERKSIFYTSVGKLLYEETARKHIQEELEQYADLVKL